MKQHFIKMGLSRHNFYYYSEENPRFFQMVDRQHRWLLHVWAAIEGNHIVGSYFFDGHLTGQTQLHFQTRDLDDLLMDILREHCAKCGCNKTTHLHITLDKFEALWLPVSQINGLV